MSANFDDAFILGVFDGADLQHATFSRANIIGVMPSAMESVDLERSTVHLIFSGELNSLTNCNFNGSRVDGLSKSADSLNISDCSFDRAFVTAGLLNASFSNCSFQEATARPREADNDWRSVVFENCNFRDATLGLNRSEVTFRNCDLTRTKVVCEKTSTYGYGTVVKFDDCILDDAIVQNCEVHGNISGSCSIKQDEMIDKTLEWQIQNLATEHYNWRGQ